MNDYWVNNRHNRYVDDFYQIVFVFPDSRLEIIKNDSLCFECSIYHLPHFECEMCISIYILYTYENK